MTDCNFLRLLQTDLETVHFCPLKGALCDGDACIFQRILAALPLTASPIVAQAMDAIGTGPGDVVPVFPESITYQTEESTHGCELKTSFRAQIIQMYTQTHVAEESRIAKNRMGKHEDNRKEASDDEVRRPEDVRG